jgi:[ribosomal protein S5]-alanine N-acetyltransferase
VRWLRRKPGPPPVLSSGGGSSAAARPTSLRTQRLLLRPLREADVDALHALWTQPALRRFLWDDRMLTREQTRDAVAQSAWWFEQQGYGLWAAQDGEGALVGFCGYGFFRDEHELELLYGVDPQHWMRGYAREMAGSVVAYGLDTLRLAEIRASTDADNAGSQRVLRRLGFVRDGARPGADGKLYFRLPRARREAGGEDWEAA